MILPDTMIYKIRWAALMLLITVSACTDGGRCVVSTLGDMTVINESGSPIVSSTVNGHPVAFILDTGARSSSVWPGQVEKLGLENHFKMVRLRGTGGEAFGGVATAETVGLGSATASNVVFVTAGNLFDGRTINGLPVVGLLGADFLDNYDVVLDLPNHRINLYTIDRCGDALPAWKGRFYKIKVSHAWEDETKTIVHIRLNGHPIDAYLDSGASGTLISRDDARAAGVKKSDLFLDRKGVGYGIDDEKSFRYLHHFDTMDVGPFHFSHPILRIAETDNSLLGADFLRHHRVWIPRHADWIFIQPVAQSIAQSTNTPAMLTSHQKGL